VRNRASAPAEEILMETDATAFVEAGLAALADSIERRGELRTLQMATVDRDDHPDLRSVILRAFEREPSARAEIHSDARAAKVGDILRTDRVALLAWSAEAQLQIRLRGSARLHRADAIASARWETLSTNARDPYGTRAVPGTPIADPADRPHLPPNEQFAQFVVIRVQIFAVDVLKLGPHGDQRRASGLFTSSDLAAHWVGA
jgi:hypothetical protein